MSSRVFFVFSVASLVFSSRDSNESRENIETMENHAVYLRAQSLRIRYSFGYFHSRLYADIRRIDNGIRLLLCHPLPWNNTLPSYNSLLADWYFCPIRRLHTVLDASTAQFVPFLLAPIVQALPIDKLRDIARIKSLFFFLKIKHVIIFSFNTFRMKISVIYSGKNGTQMIKK